MTNEIMTIRQWRGMKELSQERLSELSGISERTIQIYEKDPKSLYNAKYSTIKRIADAMNIKVSNIFLDDTSEKPKQEEVK